MNIKKHVPKFTSVLLSFAMLFSNVLPAYAAEAIITESALEETEQIEDDGEGLVMLNDDAEIQADSESRYEEIEVNYSQSSSYFVTIPKNITLGADKRAPYSVKVEGDIVANKQVCVVPVDGITDTEVFDFYMEDQIAGSTKEDVVAEVSQAKFYWNHEEAKAGYEEHDNYIVADGLSAGRWKGTFQMEISMRTDPSHIHNYVGEITKEPACTEPGEKTYTCDCGESYTETIDPTGHHYENGECTDCGEKYPDHEHSYREVITKEPTCTEAGEKTYTCDCGDSYTEEIPATGHNFVDGECEHCGEKDPDYHNHHYTEVITKEPTCTEPGEKTYTCDCGDSYTEEISAKGHHFEDGECTDCDEKDPDYVYPIGTQTDSADWDYTLDYANKIITLNYYKSNKANVTVYGSYEINGVVYNTKIKSNSSRSYTTKYMFNGMAQSGCKTIETITFNKDVDTSEVTSMVYMFYYCQALTTLDLSGFDTSNVTNMACMFDYCYKLTTLDLSNFNTSNVTEMENMFADCVSLTDVDVSSFDTSNVTDMSKMFYNTALTILDLTNFEVHQGTNISYMFGYSSKLCAVYVTEGKWTINELGYSPFQKCNISKVTYV